MTLASTGVRRVRKRSKLDPIVVLLHERRVALRLSTKAVAQKAGVSPDTIRHLEGGWTGGTFDIVRAIATALDCDIDLVPQPIDQEEGEVSDALQGEGLAG